VISRLDEAVREYSAQFDKIMGMLKDQDEKVADFVRFLTFRLDFNDYHATNKRAGLSMEANSPKQKNIVLPSPLGDVSAGGPRSVPSVIPSSGASISSISSVGSVTSVASSLRTGRPSYGGADSAGAGEGRSSSRRDKDDGSSLRKK